MNYNCEQEQHYSSEHEGKYAAQIKYSERSGTLGLFILLTSASNCVDTALSC